MSINSILKIKNFILKFGKLHIRETSLKLTKVGGAETFEVIFLDQNFWDIPFST